MGTERPGPTGDHRVRVARARRDRMNERLLAAVLECYAASPQQPPTVDDVIRQAGVSRATFYKYFNSVEQAAGILGGELGQEMVEGLITLFDGPETPLFRVSTVVLLFMMRAVIDPVWGRFISRTDYLTQDTPPLIGMTALLASARDAEVLEFKEVDAAATLTVGAMMEAIRRMARTGKRNRAYVEELAALVLRALGLGLDEARETVRERTIFIRGLAPDRLAWWRDPWR
jgi:AcrR family transcriptional regulator